jgi:hypothetical protein
MNHGTETGADGGAGRRHYLTLAGGALAALAGCTDLDGGDGGGGATPTETPAGQQATATGTLAANGTPALGRLDAPFAQRAVGRYYLAVATAQDHGERLATAMEASEGGRESEAPAFLRETDYGGASVVCVQEALSSSVPDLELQSARIDGAAVTLATRYPGNAGTDDITTDLLLVRVAHPEVTHATVAITGQTDTTTRLSTVGRYGRSQLDDPRPLVVRNRDCERHHLHVSATVGGALVAAAPRSEAYPPASVVRYGAFLTEVAEYTVRVSRGRESSAETTLSTTAGTDDPQGVLVDVAGGGQLSVEARSVGELPTAASGECEASSLPYESSDPAENVADPAGFQWRNRSGADRRLRLAVRDGGQPVVERELELTAGGKGRTEALVAKRGVYDTSLVLDGETERRVDWQVDEGGDDLQALVEADGSLTVATDSLA